MARAAASQHKAKSANLMQWQKGLIRRIRGPTLAASIRIRQLPGQLLQQLKIYLPEAIFFSRRVLLVPVRFIRCLVKKRLYITRHRLGLILRSAVALGAVAVGALVVFSILTLRGVSQDLPAVQSIYGKNLSGSIQYYDSSGKVLLWTDHSAINRTPVPADQIPDTIRHATIAIEDRNFYHEGALNFSSILRALVHDVFNRGEGLQGGSTITQQLVKLNEDWIGNVSLSRKIREMYLAYNVSHRYSKDTILTGYLNIVPYGSTDYGIQAAAQDYFHESPAQLTLAQSAMLAAIPESPAYYSPRSPDFSAAALNQRKAYVLSLMQRQGYITLAEADAAKADNTLAQVQQPESLYANMTAPYFDMAAKQQLEKQFGSGTAKGGGWKVITTLHIDQQRQAEKLVADNLSKVTTDGGDDEAVVVEHVPTGQVTALVGGTDFNNADYGQINYATVPINPGSSYKLYDYTALINDSSNVGAGSVLYDIKQPLPGYPCTDQRIPEGNCLYDYDYQYPGPLTLRYALAGSRNVPAVKAMLIAGEQKTIDLSKAMGLTRGYNCYTDAAKEHPTQCFASAAIGYGFLSLNESVNGYATDARLGNYVPQTFLLSITDANGKTIYRWEQPAPQQVVKPDAAYIVDNMLSDPGASYLPGSCSDTTCTSLAAGGFKFHRTNGWQVAIKTGTTDKNNSGLMMAMTSQYSVGSWIGYHTADRPIVPHFGGLEADTEPLTRGMIDYVTQGQTPANWTQPEGMKRLAAFIVNNPPAPVRGSYYGWHYPSTSTDLYPSWFSTSLAAATSPCDAADFSVDTFMKGTAGRAPNTPDTSTGNTCNTAPPAQQSNPRSTEPIAPPAIRIDQVTCDYIHTCDITITVANGTPSSPEDPRASSAPSTVSLLDNGQILDTFDLPPDSGGTYTATFTAQGINVADVLTAEIVTSKTGSAMSAPVVIGP